MTKWQILGSVFNSIHFSGNFITCIFLGEGGGGGGGGPGTKFKRRKMLILVKLLALGWVRYKKSSASESKLSKVVPKSNFPARLGGKND